MPAYQPKEKGSAHEAYLRDSAKAGKQWVIKIDGKFVEFASKHPRWGWQVVMQNAQKFKSKEEAEIALAEFLQSLESSSASQYFLENLPRYRAAKVVLW